MATFTYFDEEFRYSDEGDPFAVTEFAEAVDSGVDSEALRGVAAAWRVALSCVHDEDKSRFRQVSRKNRAKSDDYVAVFWQWLSWQAERPTRQPSDSSDGQSVTGATSDSAPVASVTPIPTAEPRPANGAVALALARSRPA
jgi:hypothetical protein